MLKKIIEHPVGTLVWVIVLLVLVARFLEPILITTAVAVVLVLVVAIIRSPTRNGDNRTAFCGQCGHVDHGRQACRFCHCGAP